MRPPPRRCSGLTAACSVFLLFVAPATLAGEPPYLPKTFTANIRPGWTPSCSLELQGNSVLYSKDAGPDKTTIKVTPTREQWRAFRRALDEQNVWRWRAKYFRSVSDSTAWSIHIEYPDRSLTAEGYAAFPARSDDPSLPKYAFARYRLAIQKLIGDRPFPQLVKPVQLFDLDELKLVATHRARNERDQWADFRDPDGKVHRIRRGEAVGNGGTLEKVTGASVSIKEVVLDTDGNWIMRERVLEKTRPQAQNPG